MTSTPADTMAHTAHPRRAAGTEVHPPSDDSTDRWVLQRGERYLRVDPEIARLVLVMDGNRSLEQLATTMGGHWHASGIETVVHRLDGFSFIERDGLAPPRRPGRLQFVPPLTLQFTVLRPGTTMQRLRPAFVALSGPIALSLAFLFAVAGMGALAAQRSQIDLVLGSPLPITTYLAVLVGLIVGTSIHELGHAATLIRHGGRPSRIGVMIFYLLPAFFCDVSDGWRLPRRSQRVKVALAGPAVQTSIAGAAALTALVMPSGDLQSAVIFFAIGSYVTGLLNLIPLVKLDGYLALMSAVDIPFLRDRAMTDARRMLAQLIFGGQYAKELPHRWTTWYGLLCLAFPFYLLTTALALWLDLLQAGGLYGLALAVLAIGYAAHILIRGSRRVLSEVRAAHPNRARALGVGILLTAGTLATAFVPAGTSVQGAYLVTDGQTELVLQDQSRAKYVTPGQPVTLTTNGIVQQSTVGRAEVAGPAYRTDAPLTAFMPLSVDSELLSLPAVGHALTPSEPLPPHDGLAEVDTGQVPLWRKAYRDYLEPFIAR